MKSCGQIRNSNWPDLSIWWCSFYIGNLNKVLAVSGKCNALLRHVRRFTRYPRTYVVTGGWRRAAVTNTTCLPNGSVPLGHIIILDAPYRLERGALSPERARPRPPRLLQSTGLAARADSDLYYSI